MSNLQHMQQLKNNNFVGNVPFNTRTMHSFTANFLWAGQYEV